MKPRRVIDSDLTPNGERIELLFEAGDYVVRVNGAPLMSGRMYGSEQEMARVAAERLGGRAAPRLLVGGLGMGFTLRAVLDCFGADAAVTVAELLPAVIRFNRGELGPLTDHPLDDPRVTLHQGDVRVPLADGGWDAILLDIDNGPEAFTVPSNADLYGSAGVAMMVEALAPGGVSIIWSAFPFPSFERTVAQLGLVIESLRVRARSSGKGPRHTLFVIAAPPRWRPSR